MDQSSFRVPTIATLSTSIVTIVGYFVAPILKAQYGEEGLQELSSAFGILVTGVLSFAMDWATSRKRPPPGIGQKIGLIAILALGGAAVAEAAPSGRIVLSERETSTGTVAEWRIAPQVVINAVTIPLERRSSFEAGVDVGGCYAVAWSPSWWDKNDDSPFFSIGPCLELGLVVDGPDGLEEGSTFFAVQAVGIITLMRWVQFGAGYRHRLALSDEGRDNGEPVLVFGLTAATF